MSRFIKDLLSVAFSKTGIIIFSLLKTVIIARYLGPEKNGILAALTVYPTLFMAIGSMGISQATTYIVGKNKYDDEDIKKTIVQLWSVSSIICLIFSFFLLRYFSNYGYNLYFIILAILPIPFALFNIYNAGYYLGKNRVSSFNKVNWIPSFVTFIIAFLLIVVINFDIDGALIAIFIGPFLISVYLFKKNNFVSNLEFNINKKVFVDLLKVGSVFALSSLVINLNYKADLILLDKLSDEYNLGIYSRGSVLIESLWQLPMLFSPIIFARSANANDGNIFSLKVTQLLRLSIISVLIVLIIFIIFSDLIVLILFGSEFIESAQVIILLSPGILFFVIFKVLWVDLAGKGQVWDALKAMSPALIINIVSNIIFIPMYGATGAAISSTISYSIAGILFLFIYSKKTGLSIIEILRIRSSDFQFLFNKIDKRRK